jgi:hypothetical protein
MYVVCMLYVCIHGYGDVSANNVSEQVSFAIYLLFYFIPRVSS